MRQIRKGDVILADNVALAHIITGTDKKGVWSKSYKLDGKALRLEDVMVEEMWNE